MESKTITATCGCKITRLPGTVDTVIIGDQDSLREIHDVQIERCAKCTQYVKKRNALIPNAVKAANAAHDRHKEPGKWTQVFHNTMDKMARKAGLVS